MSQFQIALHHCAATPHGIEKLVCLRSALLAHQAIMVAATGEADGSLSCQIEEIDALLQGDSAH